jgi:hypothetical protein
MAKTKSRAQQFADLADPVPKGIFARILTLQNACLLTELQTLIPKQMYLNKTATTVDPRTAMMA